MNTLSILRFLGDKKLGISATDINAGAYLQVDGQGKALSFTNGAPTAATAGFAKGGIAIDYTNGAVYYNSGSITSSTWTGLAGGSSSTIAYNATLEDSAGLDATIRVTDQTVSKPVLTIPNLAGASDSFAFIGATQTLTNKTLTAPDINGGTADLLTSLSVKSPGAYGMKLAVSNTLATADRILTVTLASDAAQTVATPVGLTSSKLVGYTSAATAAQGDVLYHNGTAWTLLTAGSAGQSLLTGGAGANVYWGSPSVGIAAAISNGAILEDAGALDAILAFTQQTVSAPTLTVPDCGGANQSFVFTALAQTLTNKTLTSPTITTMLIDDGDAGLTVTSADQTHATPTATIPNIGDAADSFVMNDTAATLTAKTLTAPKIVTGDGIFDAGGDELVLFTESATPVNYITLVSADTGTPPQILAGGSDANIDLSLRPKATGNVYVTDGTDPTKDLNFELAGATADKTMTITSSQTDDRALTLPNATDTLVGKATTDTLTNKTIDADGTGNVISNINMDEMDQVAAPTQANASDAVYASSGIIVANISNQAAAVNIFSANAPFAFRVIRAWSINKSGDGGTWKLNNGAAGAGTDITNAVTVAANDQDIDEPTDYNDAAYAIAASGSLSIIPDGAGLLDCEIYIQIIRMA